MILLCGRLHQNHIEYYSLIMSLYNVYKFLVTLFPWDQNLTKQNLTYSFIQNNNLLL